MPSSAAKSAAAITIQNNVEEERLSTVLSSTVAHGQQAAYRHPSKSGMK